MCSGVGVSSTRARRSGGRLTEKESRGSEEKERRGGRRSGGGSRYKASILCMTML